MEKYCIAGQATDYIMIWRMHIACCITKATNTDSEFVVLISSLLQRRLQERVSVLRVHLDCVSC